uniref:Uncharacterized protein n=1 Tax=Cajanus cajan TaxID=3821 RepID=A0A151RE96_CAJCA|nr:hypothetical protein KK1_037708 [Cajanus cajan]
MDREEVIEGGPWMIFDHYIMVRPWILDFVASNEKIDCTLAWIHFPCLGINFYDTSMLLAFFMMVGVGKLKKD